MTEQAFYTIREVSAKTGLPGHTIRRWESLFRIVRPMRRLSGHRRYTAKDIETLNNIKNLVYVRGFTVSGAKKAIRNRINITASTTKIPDSTDITELLEELQKELSAIIKEC